MLQFGLEISNRMLNCSITDTEIENVVRNLPNNKAVGTELDASLISPDKRDWNLT
jgi:hypothetical protein